jgi:hypothetical protein
MGELPLETDANSLSDLYATALQGISVQARGGVRKKRLLAMVPSLLSLFKSDELVRKFGGRQITSLSCGDPVAYR